MQLIFENARGQRLDLLRNKDKFKLTGAEGLHGIDTDTPETESSYSDGATLGKPRALPRGIALKFAMCGDVAASLDYFHSFIKSKQRAKLIKIEYERETKVEGVVTIPPYTRYSPAVAVEVHIYCGQPYWEDVTALVGQIARIIDLLYFPENGRGFPVEGVPFGLIDNDNTKTFTNDGDADVGMTIVINAHGPVPNPRIACTSGTQNGWYMKLNITLEDGDEVIITTHKNNKSITINGSEYKNGVPILSVLEYAGSDWLQFETGENTFNVLSDDENAKVYFNIYYSRRWER